jgi:uncharacterized protein HemY
MSDRQNSEFVNQEGRCGAKTRRGTVCRQWPVPGRTRQHGNTAAAGTVISQLGSLYIEERRFEEARRLLDRAWALFTSAEDTVTMDRIKLLNNRATLHARQGQWREAGEDLRLGITMVDQEAATQQ